MVAITADKIVVEFQADTSRYVRDIVRAQRQVTLAVGAGSKAIALAQQQISLASSASRKEVVRNEKLTRASLISTSNATRGLGSGVKDAAEKFNQFVDGSRRKGFDLRKVGKEIKDINRQLKGGASASRVFGRQLLKIVGQAGPVGKAVASAAEIGLSFSEAFDDSSTVKSAEERISDLRTAVEQYTIAAQNADISTVELARSIGEFANEQKATQRFQRDLKKIEVRDGLNKAVQSIGSDFSQFGRNFDNISEEKLRNIDAEIKELQSAFADGTGRSQTELDGLTRSIFELSQRGRFITSIADKLGISRDAAIKLTVALGRISSATGPKEQISAIREFNSQLNESNISLKDVSENTFRVLKNVSDSASSAIKLAGNIDTAADSANKFNIAFARSSGNAATLLQQAKDELDISQVKLSFVGDNVGLAGALKSRQFDASTKPISGLDRQDRTRLDKEAIDKLQRVKTLTIEVAKETAANNEELIKGNALLKKGVVVSGGRTTPGSGSGRETRRAGAKDVPDGTSAVKAQADAHVRLNPLVRELGFASEKTRIEQELLAKAQAAGIPITDELKAQIEQLATAYAMADASSKQLAGSQQSLQAAVAEFNGIARDAVGGFIDDIRSGESAADALENALRRIEDRLIDIALNSVFDSSGGGLLGGLLGGAGAGNILGFKQGGKVPRFMAGGQISGPGTGRSDSIVAAGPAGPLRVSDGEFIVNANATRKHLKVLEAINAGNFKLPGFAEGGLVTPEAFNRRLALPEALTPRGQGQRQSPSRESQRPAVNATLNFQTPRLEDRFSQRQAAGAFVAQINRLSSRL